MKLKLNWGNGLLLFFIVFFVWVFSFVFFAMRQNTDLVADDYYQKGAKYSDQIEINRRSIPYQDSLQINITDSQVQIVPSKGMSYSVDSVEVYFFKSSDKTKDIRFYFSKADVPLLIEKNRLVHGRYQVFVTWNYREEKYSIKKVVDIE